MKKVVFKKSKCYDDPVSKIVILRKLNTNCSEGKVINTLYSRNSTVYVFF